MATKEKQKYCVEAKIDLNVETKTKAEAKVEAGELLKDFYNDTSALGESFIDLFKVKISRA